MKTSTSARFAALIFLAAPLSAAPPNGPLVAVQTTLKTHQFYFGEVTGKMDDETRAAVRRFQIHRGLDVTGELDNTTLEALQSAATNTDADSVRARAQQTKMSDQEFLDRIESGVIAPARQPPPPPAKTVGPSKPPRPSARPDPAPTERPLAPPPSNEFTEARVVAFVRDYLVSAEGPSPEREVSFYADRVNYFDSGRVSHAFIERDQRNYYRRWTDRKFDLIEEPEVMDISDDRATVRFRIRYALRGPNDSARGTTENIMQIQQTDRGLKIVGMRERQTRD